MAIQKNAANRRKRLMRQWRLVVLIAASLAASLPALITPLAAEDRSQARSMVISQYGIVAAEQPIAARAGTAVLENGGNAIDAAVAANAAMGLVAPMMDGIGGDLFAIVYEAKTNKVYGLNASGWAPKGLTPEFLQSKGLQWMPSSGIHSVTVPGAVAGWDALLSRFGKKAFADVLAPAIAYAKVGFPVTELFGDDWVASTGYLSRNREAARVYLPVGRAPAVGEIFRNPDLAAALAEIAKDGRDAFYKGALASGLLATWPKPAATRW